MSQVAELNLRRVVREVLREELTSGDSATRTLLLDLLKQAIREELTSGDPAVRKLLTELVLSALLKDSQIMVPTDLQARYKPPAVTLYSGTVTASGNTTDIDVSKFSSVRIMAKVTAVSGTSPTLDIHIEGKYEATGDYVPLLSRTGITATGVYELGQLDNLCFRYIRVRWVVGGTSPSFTFIVIAQAMV